jgi:hypothetical protein
MRDEMAIKERVEAIVATYLGRSTAESAVRISAKTWLGIVPEALAAGHEARFCDGLKPMLRTLLGAEVSAVVIDRVREEFRR